MISRVTKVLAESGIELAHEELLDAIWLAGKLPQDSGVLARSLGVATAALEHYGEPRRDGATASKTAETAQEPTTAASTKKLAPHPLLASAQPSLSQGVQASVELSPAVAVRAPDSSTLGAGQLRLGKSLRPLRQRFPDRGQHELDVTRTVAAIADTGVPETVTRAVRTRWLSLALVVDDGVSMVLWQRLAADVRTLMERAGAFRDVKVYGLDTRSGTPFLRTSPYRHRGRRLTPKALCEPTGNTLVLVISDGVGEAWLDGTMRQVMDHWGRCGPTAIIQALPSRLWASTGISARRWQVTTHRRGGPTRSWRVNDPDLPPDLVRFDSIAIPVLAPTPAAVADWAGLVASPGGTSLLRLWDAGRVRSSSAVADALGGDPAKAVLRFREAASADAYRLAAHMAAVAPVTPPVMRLVQAALGPPTDLGHVMEVFLGGLMHELDAGAADRLPHHRRFDFTDEARRVLLSAVSPRELVRTAEAVTRRVEAAVGRAPVFPAWVGHPEGTAVIEDSGRAFGWLREQTLTRLGIPSANAEPVAVTPEPPSGSPEGETENSAGPPVPAAAASDEAYAEPPGEPLPLGWVELLPEDPVQLGRFRLRARSAHGWPHLTMYLAEDEDGTVATVRASVTLHASDPEAARDLVRTEAECLTRMQGMHVPALLGVAASTTGELPWVAASCIHRRADSPSSPPAPNLRAVLDEYGGAVPEELFLRIGLGLTQAVALAHSRGLVHGSIAPRAVLVTDRDVRLVGWATATVDGVDSAHRHVLPLSDTYLDAADDGSLTPQSDMYAVGALLLAYLSGQWSDPKANSSEHGPGPNPGIAPVLMSTLRRCLEKDPSRRPTAAALGEAFAAGYEGHTADRASTGAPPVRASGKDLAEGDRPVGNPLAPDAEETVTKLPRGPRTPADESGTLVEGRYLLTQKRHVGMTSTTWQATDEQQGRDVTLKLFNAPTKDTASGEENFIADAERLAALDIQGLVRVTGYGVHDRRPYLVTDAVNGEDLEQLLKRAPGTLSFDTIRDVGRQIAQVLAEFHSNGLLHLDLSSSALVLSQDGRVIVTDPGQCVRRVPRIDLHAIRPTRSPSPFLPLYRSYEEIFENVTADSRSDLYSLGCLLYAMATGAAPLPPTLAPQEADADHGPRRRPELPSGFPPDLESLVTDLLAINPEHRPASTTAVLDRLAGRGVDDEELLAACRALRDADPDGARMGRVLRDALDEVLDGEVTGRYDLKHITKTERTHIGGLVHTAIQREFRFEDGQAMDFRIADVDVDCRFSLQFGGWMLPPGTLGHLCLLVWADDYLSRWSVGLLRVNREWLNRGGNRDLRTTLKAEHRNKIVWLWRDAELAENILLHISEADREAVFASGSGQARLNELFRRVQRRRIARNTVRTVVQQRDYMKRVRGSGGSRSALRDEGIIILGDYDSHRRVARQLGLPVPREGEFISARVAPAVHGAGKAVVEMDGRLWSLASPGDPVHRAPALPSHLPPTASTDRADGPRGD